MAASLRGLAFWGKQLAANRAAADKIPRAVYGGRHTVTVIPGDAMGHEIMPHVREVFKCADIPVDFEEINISKSSEEDDTVKHALLAIKRNGVCLKGNIETDAGTILQRSKNVVLRTQLDLFANVVHCQSIPGVKTRHDDVDLVIIRENTEGEYSNLEHENVPGVVESLKIITAQKSTRIAKFAFDFAVKHGRKKVTAIHKANIMKLGDGLFLESCRQVSELYPNIEFDSMIIDNASMQMVSRPQQFDVMVMPNLYGNILSNIGAGLVGGSGIIAGSNIGENHAIFEMGTRGSSGRHSPNKDNPNAMLLAGCAMLDYIGLHMYANTVRSSIFKILSEDKALPSVVRRPQIHTEDLGGRAGTSEVVDAIIRDIRAKK